MDDPDQGLDEGTRQFVLDHLVRLREDRKRTVVLTTTDPEVVHRLGVRVMRLQAGHLIQEGHAA
jgi:ABC-type multidrug transport system ATPase subunit